ncbi:hypothetical protein HYPSUDRAFT_143474 [Hypholoma sublateritium FD-334 SS-4]|uniref:Uncharacterized protein n=1 Tax=Hypholoma sublateritium (strain FD-334 SS-4) TaxID=945553 RepID=A0A0D2M8M2_HYPSF|nr:hypothetical protein HYPSUDRAFT_143474 [Hypholoma sublateritium FD-334 SS-4]
MAKVQQLQKGSSSARSDDIKTLKSAILDWLIAPGDTLYPSISANVKANCGFRHEATGALLCPVGIDWNNLEIKQKIKSGKLSVSGDQWPIMLYASHTYDQNSPWKGLLRSSILIKIFAPPSGSRNAITHAITITSVTPASIAYAATHARFALSSSAVFSQSNTITESELFYNCMIDHLEDPNNVREVDHLLAWWDRLMFPKHAPTSSLASKNSVLAKIRAKRKATKLAALVNPVTSLTQC